MHIYGTFTELIVYWYRDGDINALSLYASIPYQGVDVFNTSPDVRLL